MSKRKQRRARREKRSWTRSRRDHAAAQASTSMAATGYDSQDVDEYDGWGPVRARTGSAVQVAK